MGANSWYVDIHTHLTHAEFADDLDAVIERAVAAGLGAVVVNGLEPKSNRKILELAARWSVIKPALGIYPLDAANKCLPESLPFPVQPFDVDSEMDFIEAEAKAGRVFAIGECGLDGYWVGEETFLEQERVFRRLIEISIQCDIPIIVHTRKLEERSMAILREHNARRVDLHCFGGRVTLAKTAAEQHGWWLSIPANARVNEAFTKMLKVLPPEKILTETDAPWLSPRKGERNEPANVAGTVEYLASLRGWTLERAREQVWSNFQTLAAKGPL
jgi:TatD DNase family protein